MDQADNENPSKRANILRRVLDWVNWDEFVDLGDLIIFRPHTETLKCTLRAFNGKAYAD